MATKISLLQGSGWNTLGNIVWLSSTKAIATQWLQHGVSPAYIQVRLIITNNAGASWSVVSGTSMTWEFWLWETTMDQGVGTRWITANRDSSNNIYVHMWDSIIKYTKGSGDNWTGSRHVISTWNGGKFAALLFVKGTNNLVVMTADDPFGGIDIRKHSTTNLSSWTYELIADGGPTRKWHRSGALVGGNAVVVGMDGFAPSIDTTVHVSMAATSDGRVHMVYFDSSDNKIYHIIKTGSTWGTPVEIGDYNDLVGTSTSLGARYGEGLHHSTTVSVLTSDGIGLVLGWIEYDELANEYNMYAHTWDTVNWSNKITLQENIDRGTGESSKGTTDQGLTLGGPFGLRNQGLASISFLETNSALPRAFTISIDYPPHVPTSLTPSSGEAVPTLEPTLAWTFNHPTGGESQSAYQIIITRQSDSVVIWDSGKIASTDSNAVVPSAADLDWQVNYQWRVKTWDTGDREGPYSSNALFKASQPPAAIITNPAHEGTVATDTPLIEWDFDDPAELNQNAYEVQITNQDGNQILDTSGVLNGGGSNYLVAGGMLINGVTYQARVRVRNSDNIWSTWTQNEFTVEFISPPAPSVHGIVDQDGFINLDIEVGTPEDSAWYTDVLRIYRKRSSDTNFELVKDNLALVQTAFDSFNNTDGWSTSGEAEAPIESDPKVGSNSMGLGTTGAGNGVYTKAPAIGQWNSRNRVQLWLYALDTSKFDKIIVKFGPDDENYFTMEKLASEINDTVWTLLQSAYDDLSATGSPNRNSLNYLEIVIEGATEAISAGDIRIDHFRAIRVEYTYKDTYTEIDRNYLYAVSAYNNEQFLESPRTETDLLLTTVTRLRTNTYLIPEGAEDLMIYGWMDGSQNAGWTQTTETRYYQTKGLPKPTPVINNLQAYKEGSVELRLFDQRFEGSGLAGVDGLEFIKNFKPIILRTWWGRNYRISIDGEVTVQRAAGLGWYCNFNFTEMN